MIIATDFRPAWLVGFLDAGGLSTPTRACARTSGKILKWMNALGLTAVLMTAFVTMARAGDAVELNTELIAEVRETIGAQERQIHRMVPATTLAQGQVVYYTLRITNPTPVFANDVVVSQLIPANTTYLPGSAAGPGADIEFSIDGGLSFARAGDLKLADGSRAPHERYTHIRWRLRNPLAAGAVALARFRAVFN